MGNPTTNYSWVLPTPTDLVTDLPADFDVALQGVDNTVKALNPETTLGDISYRSSTANTKTRLGIGTSGQVLTVSSGVPAWTTIDSGGMTVISSGSLSGTTFTLSSIPTTYKDLIVRLYDVGFNSGADTIRMRVNNNSGSLYGIRIFTDGSIITATTSSSWNIQYTWATADNFVEVRIPAYSTTVSNKVCNFMNASDESAAQSYFYAGWGIAQETAAITRLDLFSDSGYTFNAGTYELIGVK